MTAEPIGELVWSPDPMRQKLASYTVEDVLRLPDYAPVMELTDGVLTAVPSPTGGHQEINSLLIQWLRRNLPEGYQSLIAVGLLVDGDTTREPDALILRSPVDLDRHFFLPSQTVVVVEIVSAGAKRRDRLEKPGLYASAGIRHYWRIEQKPVHVFAYDLVEGRYELAADSAEELVLSRPFEIKLPIRDITP
jgi:Uma2 family endonuclease